MALGLAGKLRDEGFALPGQLILISPWLDVASDNVDMEAYDDLDMMLSLDGTQQGGINYVGENNLDDLDHPYASPLLLENLGELLTMLAIYRYARDPLSRCTPVY